MQVEIFFILLFCKKFLTDDNNVDYDDFAENKRTTFAV